MSTSNYLASQLLSRILITTWPRILLLLLDSLSTRRNTEPQHLLVGGSLSQSLVVLKHGLGNASKDLVDFLSWVLHVDESTVA